MKKGKRNAKNGKKQAPVEETKEIIKEVELEKEEPMEEEDTLENEEVVKEDTDAEENDTSDEEEEDDDDEPTEAAIEKDEPTIPSKVKTKPIADDFPVNQIIQVKKLPAKCKVIDIVEVFAPYGPIHTVHILDTPNKSTAHVAFKNAKAASAALAAHKKAVIKGSTILVTLKKPSVNKEKEKLNKINETRERGVYVKFMKRGTTDDQLKEHFSSCGEIECVRVVSKNSITFGFVTFMDKASVENALKRHNSVLNGVTIGVFENSSDGKHKIGKCDPKFTIMLRNTQKFKTFESEKLQSIFGKCGEIDNMDIVCRKHVLAFITFKTEGAVAKAFKLNGSTVEDIAVEIEAYNPEKPKTSIFIQNIAKDVTEDDLKEHFSKAGDISAVILKKGFAIIHYKNSDGYCKSFLLNESFLKGKMIFIEPHSIRKQAVIKSRQLQVKKRPYGEISNGNAKRVKTD